MFALVVEFEILDGHTQAFDALVADTVAAITRGEPDTVVYVTHTRSDKPHLRIFYECYRDHDAFAAHEQQPHTARFLHERPTPRPPANSVAAPTRNRRPQRIIAHGAQ